MAVSVSGRILKDLSPKPGKVIRFVRLGCTNRPFFHIVLTERYKEQFSAPLEQLGSYDPIANEYNEKLISLNLERICYWIGNGATVSKPVSHLFGLAGFFHVHPQTYIAAWRSRRRAEEAEAEAKSKEKES